MMNGVQPNAFLGPSASNIMIPYMYTEHILLEIGGGTRRTCHRTTFRGPEEKRRYRTAVDIAPKMRNRRYVSTVTVDMSSGDAIYTDHVDVRPEMAPFHFSESVSTSYEHCTLYKTKLTYIPSTKNALHVSQVLLVPAQKLTIVSALNNASDSDSQAVEL